MLTLYLFFKQTSKKSIIKLYQHHKHKNIIKGINMNNDKIIIILLVVIVALLVAGMVFLNPFKTQSVVSITSDSELNEGDELSIRLTDSNSAPIPNQNVQIYFKDSNGAVTQKSVTTNGEGVGVISLGDLASGQYRVNVTFDGNGTYKASNTSQNLNIKQVVTQSTASTPYLPSDTSIHPGFTPSYRDGQIVYGYKGNRWGFVTPSGMFHEVK